MSDLPVDSKAMLLIRKMLYGESSSIHPRVGTWISYPVAESATRLNRQSTLDLLSTLWADGYLLRSFYGMAYKCPFDGSTSHRPRLTCPKCNSEDLERVQLIEHLGCGHVDREENFLRGDEYVCPVDNKKLKLIGVDYRKPGIAYYCPECDELFPEPNLDCVCTYANHVFTLHDSVPEKLYTYTINENMKLQIIKSFEYIQPLADVFREHGYKTSSYHQVKGESGVTHLVDIFAEKTTDKTETIITSLLVGDNIKPEEIIKQYAITLDYNPTRSFLIVMPQLDQQSSAYAYKLDIEVIEGTDIINVIESLKEKLR